MKLQFLQNLTRIWGSLNSGSCPVTEGRFFLHFLVGYSLEVQVGRECKIDFVVNLLESDDYARSRLVCITDI